jgi:hypothetical protein
LMNLLSQDVIQGQIQAMRIVANPDKLARI